MSYSFDGYLEALGRDWWADDPSLRTVLRHHGLRPEQEEDLASWARWCATEAAAIADNVDDPQRLPRLQPRGGYGVGGPWVEVAPGARRLLARMLHEGIGGLADNELVQYAKAFLVAQVGESGAMCATACTDGLVRVLNRTMGEDPRLQAIRADLGATGLERPIHGAQFVTERQGGSDAGTNSMQAEPQEDGSFRLSGEKWFCSNLWADYWAVTARLPDARPGSRGLSLFVVPRQIDGRLNGHTVLRLKDKLGTRALPTGEIEFEGAVGYLVGPADQGVNLMVGTVLTTSRWWTGLAAVSAVRQSHRVAGAYAGWREAFGGPIARFGLIRRDLDALEALARQLIAASFQTLTFWRAARRPEAEARTVARGRFLISVHKAACTFLGTRAVHQGMMVLGGNGIEERFSPLPRLLRDGVILETWEGPHGLLTHNALGDLKRFGVAGHERTFLQGLMGRVPAVDELATELADILGNPDPQSAQVEMWDWILRFYPAYGEAAWNEASRS